MNPARPMGPASVLVLEPYRLLFPFGYCFLLLGLGIWSVDLPAHAAQRETIHGFLLGNGFLFSFASGILLTETPRLQGSRHAGNIQLGFFMANLLAMGAAGMSGSIVYAYAFHFQASFTLCAFLGFALLMAEGRRQPGPAIAFAASCFALAWDLVGLLAEAGAIPRGIGGQAALAGFQGFFFLFAMASIRWSKENGLRATRTYGIPLAVALLTASLALELLATYAPRPEPILRTAYLGRAAWLAWYLRRPAGYASLMAPLPMFAWVIRVGTGFMLAGNLLAALFPARIVAINHVTFLTGFAWMVLAAATGIIVQRIRIEKHRAGPGILISAGLFLAAAAILRVSAEFPDGPRSALLSAGAALALAPMLFWAFRYFPLLSDWGNGKSVQSP